VRPDGAMLLKDDGQASGHAQAVVRRIEHLGDQKHVHLALRAETGDVELITLCADPSGLEPGRSVSVRFTAPLFFDAAGQRIVN
jgi:multiple sugar transport system ATP-binding protein